jgi:K+-sensing histidine kinase KdpD
MSCYDITELDQLSLNIGAARGEASVPREVFFRVLRLLACAGVPVAILTVCQKVPHVNATTAGLLLVLLIVGIGGRWGAPEALVGAIVGGTGFDYLFLPPREFAFEDPDHKERSWRRCSKSVTMSDGIQKPGL